MSDRPLISVIIPIYSVEPYIENCIKSVQKQTYGNIEILVVNDGSPDHSARIVKRLSEKDARIKLFHQPNGGQSSARNFGLAQMKGEYVLFVDGDDMIGEFHIENLFCALVKHNVLLAISKMTKQPNSLNHGSIDKMAVVEGRFSALVLGLNRPGYPSVSACGKLYHQTLFAHFRYPEGMIYEDAATILQMIDQVSAYVLVDAMDYYYRINPNSTTTTTVSAKNFDILKKNRMQLSFVKEKHPEILAYVMRNAMNDNDFVAMNAVSAKGELAEKLLHAIYEQNLEFSARNKLRRFIYGSETRYRFMLKAGRKIYYNDFIRNTLKRILTAH